ncbi:MAG: hypothetical protein JWM99_602 [Verrucomicrobiales bacterium]|nr:hypothetical protein [Verrucomicrobiales bacterium]
MNRPIARDLNWLLLGLWIVGAGLFQRMAMALDLEVVRSADGVTMRILDRGKRVFSPLATNAALTVMSPGMRTPVRYGEVKSENGVTTLTGGTAPGLSITESFRAINADLIERVVRVTAKSDQRYYLELGWQAPSTGDFYSFTGKEPATKKYSVSCSGPEFVERSLQTFPFLGCLSDDRVYGLLGDTPGLWENRSFMKFDLEGRGFSLMTGDGSPRRMIMIPRDLDATTVYRGEFDGWQHLEQGESASFTTWLFASPARSLYDVQLAAHLALANAKGFNRSGLEAILRNTSYLLLRRNLLRPESNYLFISGVGYGWKQWVSDGFWMSRGLDDSRLDREAHGAVFFERLDYEDNAQYYLIWSALVKRAGGELDSRTVSRAYHFIRDHEKEGLYFPPRLTPDKKIARTYHDQLPYEDDDAPSSNQGFHCGALIAARELGFSVTDEEIEKAISGYRRMFNSDGGYFATSLKQQDHIGQDSLYGAVLTYAVFGRKLLPDDMVQRHLETSVRVQSPYGMRVISKANGDLLDGHSGVYVFGGSWFLNDGANYLAGLIYGMDEKWVNGRLLWRLEKELAVMPAFHESISTVNGQPHGHHLYSWNSGFWWLRREVRARLGLKGEDTLGGALDRELGIGYRDGHLVLELEKATLRPVEKD